MTEIGALYYEKLQGSSSASSTRGRQHGCICARRKAAGLLRISTSVAFGRRVVVPLALRLHAPSTPTCTLDLSFEDRYTDLIAQGVDLARAHGQACPTRRWVRASWAATPG
jgi:DNA-binding transcriptional LysR family regulator